MLRLAGGGFAGLAPTRDDRVCRDAGVAATLAAREGVEVVRRLSSDTELLYLLNHRQTAIELALEAPARDIITGRSLTETVILEPQGVAILTRARAAEP